MNRILLLVCMLTMLLSAAVAEEGQDQLDEPPVTKIALIAAGNDFSLALDDKGFVWAWGLNNAAQLGLGDAMNRYAPTKVVGLENITYLSAGSNHAFAIDKKKNLYGWGDNSCGQLGLDIKKFSVAPTPEKLSKCGFPKDIIQIECGLCTTLMLTKKGEVWAVGKNEQRQLAIFASDIVSKPTRITSLNGIAHISIGRDHGVAIDDKYDVWTWGMDTMGQLSRPEYEQAPMRAIASIDQNIKLQGVSCFAGIEHSHIISPDGKIWTCGDNTYGEMGQNKPGGLCQVFIHSPQLTGYAIKLSTRSRFIMALLDKNKVWIWGENTCGQVGNGEKSNTIKPQFLRLEEDITDIAAGDNHSLVLTASGKVFAFGNNSACQCGDNTRSVVLTPFQVRFE